METNNKVFPQERLKNSTYNQNNELKLNESNSSNKSKSSLYISHLLEVNTDSYSNNKEGNMTYFCNKSRVYGESNGVLIGAYIMIIVPTGLFLGVV